MLAVSILSVLSLHWWPFPQRIAHLEMDLEKALSQEQDVSSRLAKVMERAEALGFAPALTGEAGRTPSFRDDARAADSFDPSLQLATDFVRARLPQV